MGSTCFFYCQVITLVDVSQTERKNEKLKGYYSHPWASKNHHVPVSGAIRLYFRRRRLHLHEIDPGVGVRGGNESLNKIIPNGILLYAILMNQCLAQLYPRDFLFMFMGTESETHRQILGLS